MRRCVADRWVFDSCHRHWHHPCRSSLHCRSWHLHATATTAQAAAATSAATDNAAKVSNAATTMTASNTATATMTALYATPS